MPKDLLRAQRWAKLITREQDPIEDPYIHELMKKSTPCFGWLDLSDAVCQSCPISRSCWDENLTGLVDLSASLAKARSKSRESSLISNGGAGEIAAVLNTPAKILELGFDTICGFCHKGIKKGEVALWVRRHGAMHPPCALARKGHLNKSSS